MPDTTDYEYRVDTRIGPWTLTEPLGQGGNGEVWKAKHEDGSIVALKICLVRNPQHPRFKRFSAEVEAHLLVGYQPGLLPMFSYMLPDKPTKQAPAWLAMPVAVPIRDSLGSEFQLETVVEAIAGIAETLLCLSKKGIYHRDIKPD